jgi:pimeloyl-ACP methyl ester carboxylesterase
LPANEDLEGRVPFATIDGQRIHYTVQGDGPLVVLQHGFLGDATAWTSTGIAPGLARRYRVACVDSLGHGESTKPADPACYHQAERAAHIVAVLDALGEAKAHVIGYSMGAWMTVGLAKYFPKRLASAVVGGWDLVRGLETAWRPVADERPSIEAVLAMARASSPSMTDWVTPEVLPGLSACWDAMLELDGAGDAIAGLACPVLLWNGQDDAYAAPMSVFAEGHGLPFLSTRGDHVSAMGRHANEALAGLEAFLQRSI